MKQFYKAHEEWVWFILAVLTGAITGWFISQQHFCQLESICLHNDMISGEEIIAAVTLFVWVYLFHWTCIGIRKLLNR